MRQVFIHILKRGFYAALKNNFIQKTHETLLEDLKTSIAYGVSFSLIYMPLGAVTMLIFKLSGGDTHISKPIAIFFCTCIYSNNCSTCKKILGSNFLIRINRRR